MLSAIIRHEKRPIKQCRKPVEPIRHFHILLLQDEILTLSFHLCIFIQRRFDITVLDLNFHVHISSSDTFHLSYTRQINDK
jgi:hypothetical protein